MNSVLFVNENTAFLDSMKLSLHANQEDLYFFCDSGIKAIDYIQNNKITAAVISLGLTNMTVTELTDSILDLYSDCKLLFIYNEAQIEEAIALYNSFDNAVILDKKIASFFEIGNILDIFSTENTKEFLLQKRLQELREKEKSYKKTMSDMTLILNSRIEGYNSIEKIYNSTIFSLIESLPDDNCSAISSICRTVLSDYIQQILIDDIDYNDYLDSLNVQYNQPENGRHFQLDNDDIDIYNNNIIFSCSMICRLLCEFYDKYRIRIELRCVQSVCRLDCIVDTRLSEQNEEFSDYYLKICADIFRILSNKSEFASKDGISRFRIFFINNK